MHTVDPLKNRLVPIALTKNKSVTNCNGIWRLNENQNSDDQQMIYVKMLRFKKTWRHIKHRKQSSDGIHMEKLDGPKSILGLAYNVRICARIQLIYTVQRFHVNEIRQQRLAANGTKWSPNKSYHSIFIQWRTRT